MGTATGPPALQLRGGQPHHQLVKVTWPSLEPADKEQSEQHRRAFVTRPDAVSALVVQGAPSYYGALLSAAVN